jgi:thioredoxin
MDSLDFDEIIQDEDLSIIDFSATWCMPGRMLAPILEQVANKTPNVSFYNLDIDENEDIAKRYRIFSVPTLLAFKEGKVIDSLVGLNSFDEVLAFVKRCEIAEVPED